MIIQPVSGMTCGQHIDRVIESFFLSRPELLRQISNYSNSSRYLVSTVPQKEALTVKTIGRKWLLTKDKTFFYMPCVPVGRIEINDDTGQLNYQEYVLSSKSAMAGTGDRTSLIMVLICLLTCGRGQSLSQCLLTHGFVLFYLQSFKVRLNYKHYYLFLYFFSLTSTLTRYE